MEVTWDTMVPLRRSKRFSVPSTTTNSLARRKRFLWLLRALVWSLGSRATLSRDHYSLVQAVGGRQDLAGRDQRPTTDVATAKVVVVPKEADGDQVARLVHPGHGPIDDTRLLLILWKTASRRLTAEEPDEKAGADQEPAPSHRRSGEKKRSAQNSLKRRSRNRGLESGSSEPRVTIGNQRRRYQCDKANINILGADHIRNPSVHQGEQASWGSSQRKRYEKMINSISKFNFWKFKQYV